MMPRNFLALAALLFGMLFSLERADAAIYWDSESDIARANLDGSLLDSSFVLTRSSHFSCGIDVDSHHIYWPDANSDAIGRANIDGSEVNDDFIRFAGDLPCDVAVDSDFVYWTNMAGDSIGRARLDGSEVNPSFIVTAERPCGLAVDDQAIYWSSNQEGAIWRADLSGSDESEVIVDLAPTPCALAVSDTHLYWGEFDFKLIGRAGLDGSDADLEFLATRNYPGGIDIHAGSLYWTNTGFGEKSISRADLSGGNVEQLLSGLNFPNGLAVDGRQLLSEKTEAAAPQSRMRIARMKRDGRGGVFVAVDLLESGVLHVRVRDRRVKVFPKGLYFSGSGRKWIRVTPRQSLRSRKCPSTGPRKAKQLKVTLELAFTEAGRSEVRMSRKLILQRRRCSRAVTANVRRFR